MHLPQIFIYIYIYICSRVERDNANSFYIPAGFGYCRPGRYIYIILHESFLLHFSCNFFALFDVRLAFLYKWCHSDARSCSFVLGMSIAVPLPMANSFQWQSLTCSVAVVAFSRYCTVALLHCCTVAVVRLARGSLTCHYSHGVRVFQAFLSKSLPFLTKCV